MKSLVLLFTILFCSMVYANPLNIGSVFKVEGCRKKPIECSIRLLNPTIDTAEAKNLAKFIRQYSKKYNTDPLLSVAIAFQESGIRNIYRTEYGVKSVKSKHVHSVTDVGYFQIHMDTIFNHNMNLKRLADDMAYAVEQHIKLLSSKINECNRGKMVKDAWACYHSKTPHLRKKYFRYVTNHYKRILHFLNGKE